MAAIISVETSWTNALWPISVTVVLFGTLFGGFIGARSGCLMSFPMAQKQAYGRAFRGAKAELAVDARASL
ncbi:hypothetical protein CO683_30285 [Bradyrhizobium ottawaense]|uniref:hypothetical protein n=1 Tax=Bradyrhizobium ottawaense TaxID=931866 RepID=UPI000BE86E7A|nr:hypothetical protein [Bradyrhizobium ottawaense]PDT65798.1 hypothetical protein CO683_30285 [Bradyrhizobium ottawaense]